MPSACASSRWYRKGTCVVDHIVRPPCASQSREGDHGLETARGDEVEPVDALHHRGGLGERAVDVAVAELIAEVRQIIGALVVHARRARPHRLPGIEHRGQLLVFHLDERRPPPRQRPRSRRHGGHLVADAAHLAGLERGLIPGETEALLRDVRPP